MQVVINIDDNLYTRLFDNGTDNYDDAEDMATAIRKGTVLPRGCGNLKDTDKISDRLEQLRDSWNPYGNDYESGKYDGYDCALDEVMNARTIIEANKEV